MTLQKVRYIMISVTLTKMALRTIIYLARYRLVFFSCQLVMTLIGKWHGRYIKEGNTASIIGILQKHENLIIIDPPPDVVSTGCQWRRFFFPLSVEGLILIGDAHPDEVVYQV